MKTKIITALIFAALCQLSHAEDAAPKAIAWSTKVDTNLLRKMRRADRSKEDRAVLKSLIKTGHCPSFNPFRFLSSEVSQCETHKLGKILNEAQNCKSIVSTQFMTEYSGEVDYTQISEYAKGVGFDFPKSPTNPAQSEKEFREYCAAAARLLVEAAYY